MLRFRVLSVLFSRLKCFVFELSVFLQYLTLSEKRDPVTEQIRLLFRSLRTFTFNG